MVEILDTDLLRRPALVAHVGLRSRGGTHQHHGQPRPPLARRQARIDLHLERVEQVLGDALAVEDAGVVLSCHAGWVCVRRSRYCPRFHHSRANHPPRSEEHTSELQSLMRISYAVFCLKKKTHT